eukprot:1716903-Rhodomonas_salina.2
MSLLPLLLRFLRLLCLAGLLFSVVGVASFGGDVQVLAPRKHPSLFARARPQLVGPLASRAPS